MDLCDLTKHILTLDVKIFDPYVRIVDIVFDTERLEKQCSDLRKLTRKYGERQARVIRRRLDDLRAAASLEDFRSLPGRCHELKGDRKGQLALDLVGGDRLVFEPAENPPPAKPDGGLDWPSITSALIKGIEDYHE